MLRTLPLTLSRCTTPETPEAVVGTKERIHVRDVPVTNRHLCASLTQAPLSEVEAIELAQVLSALSHPVRLRLLSLVAGKDEICSCDLETPLARSQPTISYHTRILSESGLITGEMRGHRMWWRIEADRLGAVRRTLGGS